MWQLSHTGPAGAAIGLLLAASLLGLAALVQVLRSGRRPGLHWWLLGPALLVAAGELGVLAGATGIDSAAAYARALAPRSLALHSAGRLLLLSAVVLGLSRVLLPRQGAEWTVWRALLSAGAASAGLSVMVARDAASGGQLAAALQDMGDYAWLFAACAGAGAGACTLAALRTTPAAEQARGSLQVAALGMLAALTIASAARTQGDVLRYGGAPGPLAAALCEASLELGQAVSTLIGLAALPAILATDRSLFERASPRRAAASAGILALPIALALAASAALRPPDQPAPETPETPRHLPDP